MIRWLWLVVSIAVPGVATAQNVQAIDRYFTKALADWQAPGIAFAVVRNDSVVLTRGYGVRQLGKPDAVTPNTIFAVGSTTKAFTSATLGLLVDEGKINWDDRVTTYLPDFELFDPYVTRELTIRDLLTHRSGLVRGDRLWSNSGMSRAEVLRRVRFLEPTWSFRSQYGYQNIMYLAAGTVVDKVTGTVWDDFVKQRIFEPLGMHRSFTSVVPLAAQTDVASPHEKIGGVPTAVEWANIDNIGPAGSINSSVADMAQWIRLHLADGVYGGRRLIKAETIKEMHSPHMHTSRSATDERNFPETNLTAYGLAWSLRDYRGMKLVSHGGAIRGMRAQVALVPGKKLGVVVLTNVSESSLPSAMMYWLLDRYTGGADKDWSALYLADAKAAQQRSEDERRKVEAARVTGTSPSLAQAQYAGVYADSMYGEISVTEENGGLVARFGPHYTGDLQHWHFDTYAIVWRNPVFGPTRVTFQLDASGRVRSLVYPNLGTFGRKR